ncbi:DUF2268 domain-containing putative Zn-dependent protease [Virgibacillus sp. C22-A2]|uniref:DUF2268 domain-containing putative Zn-dependent protease n=1 Tax=Virgibacillus tibetensis TaxID=3042313 RepID=A0ABU6KK88_9BACI|nr:DUF2268 domain-containing putative Zn-dependent protease [Virgibacillus sp. C22-A2]MEC5425521.1 DUF2268 domain-containing putative Zn-dependent protease [Virgibacillus sp. C22-A2]
MNIVQINPKIISIAENTEGSLENKLNSLVNKNTWMTEWRQLAQRFQLFKFAKMNEEESKTYEWDTVIIESLIRDTIENVKKHINLDNDLKITIVPALPFPWFEKLDQSTWVNGFTNGIGNIIIAVPPNPDEDFLKYMIAHEAHHSSPDNPIYKLTFDTFTLAEWYKMEGTAEYFSLSLYSDTRWWKSSFTKEIERNYWSEARNHLNTTNDQLKSRLCFGDPKSGIPYLAGYAFAYNMVNTYVQNHSIQALYELFSVEPEKYAEAYEKSR